MPKAVSDFFIKFSNGSVDREAGIIRGAVVAEQGVSASGHFAYIDKDGAFTRDESKGVKRVPMHMDAESLSSALAAAKEGGGRLRVRSDHVDSLAARGGYADNFRIEGNKLLADIHLFDAYAHRDIVMDVVEQTPELIGLSMDFGFQMELKDNMALVRVTTLNAVDIVDRGAVTPNGLFNSITDCIQVDTTDKSKPTKKMADESTPSPIETKLDALISAVTALTEACKPKDDMNDEQKAKAAADEQAKKDEEAAKASADEEKKAEEAKMAAAIEKGVNARFAALTKQLTALGIKLPAGDVPTHEGAKFAAEKDKKAEADPIAHFSALTAEERKTSKTSYEATVNAQRKHPEAYRAMLKAKGIAA